MSDFLYDTLFRLPSVDRFINRLLADLVNGRNLIVLLPLGIDPERVWRYLRGILWQREFSQAEIYLSQSPGALEPLAVFTEKIGIPEHPQKVPRAIPDLFNIQNLPDIIFVEGTQEVGGGELKSWLGFIDQWSSTCQLIRNSGKNHPVICVILEGDAALQFVPPSDVSLAVHWWWGFPSTLETHLLCRIIGEDDEWNSISIWREYILPSLAGNDISLVEEFWNVYDDSFTDLCQRLLAFSETRGWNLDNIYSWNGHLLKQQNGDSLIQQNFPPKMYQRLWANGLVNTSLEQGLELHSAAVAVLGNHDSLKHRLWRGQTQFILPQLDVYRLEICRQITDDYGPGWPLKWDRPKIYDDLIAVQESPLAVSWGYLKHLLEDYRQPARFRHYLPLIRIGHAIRNDIAHYKPIAYHDFNNLIQEARSLHPAY